MTRTAWRHLCKRLLGSLVLIAFPLMLLIGVLLPTAQNSRPSPALVDSSRLKIAHLAAISYLDYHDLDSLPVSWWALIENKNLLPETLVSAKHDKDIASRKVEALKPLGASGEITTGAWEQLGEIMLSHEHEAFNSFRPDLVAGFLLLPSHDQRWGKPAFVNFVFADNHAAGIPMRLKGEQTPQYLEMTAADRRARAELGLTPPPDYAALIREYVAEMENN